VSPPLSWFEDEGALVAALRDASPEPQTGSAPTVAGYEMLGEIGRGGQGRVWMARQTATRRLVAIKVLADPELATPSARRRLERETEIAAALDHPGIVRILGGGETAANEPYLVMEHVDGIPFDHFARSVDRDARRVVELAASACDALDAAHRRGVIHRDLKPSNVLVDRTGRVRIVDFGLARATEAHRAADGGRSLATRTGTFLGSLPWASPEQASGEPSRIEVRSDIYSLGVVLYEALTGAMPYATDGSLASALHAIESAEPRRPSAIRRELGGDLDAILLAALAKRPDERYASAAELAADLRAALAGEPIRARRETTAAALAKLARRYRRRAIAAGIVAAALLVVAGFAVRERSAALAAQERAERRFAQVRTIASGLLFDLDRAVAPLEGSRPARELIVRSALAYLRDLAPDAADDAAFLAELASAWERVGDIQGNPLVANLGDAAAARESYAEAIRLRERAIAGRSDDLDARTQLARARATQGFIELHAGRADGALAIFAVAEGELEAIEASAPNESARWPATAVRITIEQQRSDALALLDRKEETLAPLERAAELLRGAPAIAESAERMRMSAALEGRIAVTLWELRRAKEAIPHAEAAVRLQREIGGGEPDAAARRALSIELNTLASILIETGELERASAVLAESLAIRRRSLEADPMSAQARVDLAHVLLRYGPLRAKLGDATGMRAAMEEGIALRAELSAQSPKDTGRRRAEAVAHAIVGEAYEILAARDGATEADRSAWRAAGADAYDHGAMLFERMASEGLLGQSDAAIPAMLRGKSAELRAKAP
jgi:eukaryotic-like serine/threonine-protein kinase